MLVSRRASCKVLLLCLLTTLVHGDATSDLTAVQEEFFQWEQQVWPIFATRTGSKAYNDRVEDLSPETFDTKFARVQQFLLTLSTIDRGQLSRQHQYSYDVLHNMLSTFATNYPWRNYGALNPINFLDAFYLDLDYIVDITPFDSKEDFDNFTARLEAWPSQIDQMMDRMNAAIQMGTTYHNMSVRTVPDQISTVIATAAMDSVFYRPFNTTLDSLQISMETKNAMRARALTAIEQLWTALGRLRTYMTDTYLPNTRATYGVYGLPQGQDYYRACLKWHLSVDMTPEEVHQKGLQEVDRITRLMHQVMRRQDFNGTIKEYYSMLDADPQFGFNSREEILAAYDSLIHDRAYPKLPPLFKDIPPYPVIVKPLPYDGPFGMYSSGSEDGTQPGTFYVNLFRINDTKSFNMMSLTLHESVPGHHLQAIYLMTSQVPKFQSRFGGSYYTIPFEIPFFTAHSEGWALYSEFLGEEMEVYLNDYEMMGRYGDEVFRACRLVVDTGLHYFGWSRDRAIQYLSDRIPNSLATIKIEVDRYLTWPGQACAYKIGELKIKELRHKAATALGSKFDIRDFHSLLLTHGGLPLSVMETIVDDYIEDHTEGKGAAGSAARLQYVSTSTLGACLFLTSLVLAVIPRSFQ